MRSKGEWGMGFRSFAKFNIILLAKQRWRLLCSPDLLLERSLKFGYSPFIYLEEHMGREGTPSRRITSNVSSLQINIVSDLIDQENKRWKMHLITNKFLIGEATKILCIPLAQTPQDDMLAWRGKLLGSTWLEVVTNS
ncbi:reverse transcriptase [Gossypium australe]|uniref:Reverse transcriptase n=1 Tax=Gossypium australe TaxID=47621 RepID=A0A5B6UU99_9ROSI|nr:reverse transcriptase [Gossypium australe]